MRRLPTPRLPRIYQDQGLTFLKRGLVLIRRFYDEFALGPASTLTVDGEARCGNSRQRHIENRGEFGSCRPESCPSTPMTVKKANATLFAGEEQVLRDGVVGLRYLRRRRDDQPLVIFLPGGAHLARIAYGDPTSSRSDFLNYWLE